MKKALLLLVFLFVASYNSFGCSCGPRPLNFCATLPQMGIMLRVIKISQGTLNNQSLPLPYIRVKVIDTYKGSLSTDTIVVFLQDGLNCNADLSGVKNNDTLILGFNGIMAQDSMDLWGCGVFYLRIKNANVSGNINTWPNQTSMPYDSLLTFLNSSVCKQANVAEDKNLIPLPNIFPNPSNSGIFNVLIEDPASNISIAVYNQLGQLVHSQSCGFTAKGNFIQIDLSPQPKGTYFFNLTNNSGKTMTAKLLKG